MPSPQVFFYEAFEEEAEALRTFLPAGLAAEFTWKTPQERGDTAPPAPLISTRTQSLIPPAWGERLDGILTRSTGYDHITAYRRSAAPGLPCGYLPLYCNRAVAEQAMLLWMALLRRLPRQTAQFRRFERDGLTGRECEHKVLLVVGVGNIGAEVCRLGEGLGMRVFGVDLAPRFPAVHYVPIDRGMHDADIVVCAMNLTDSNRRFFDRRRFLAGKRGAVFVNVARGELADTLALSALLDEGVLGGVGLDVYNCEPALAVALRSQQTSTDPEVRATLDLARHPNVICTPHNAFNTVESVQRKAQQSIQQIEHFLARGSFLWPVP